MSDGTRILAASLATQPAGWGRLYSNQWLILQRNVSQWARCKSYSPLPLGERGRG